MLVLVLANLPIQAAPPAGDAVLRAMTDEMSRAVKELRLENLPRPYYMDQTVVESDTFSGIAVFGGLARARRDQSRSQILTVRVGDYQFDNTNFPSGLQRAYDVYSLPL